MFVYNDNLAEDDVPGGCPGDPEESDDDAGAFQEFPGLPTSASKSECYKDGGERKALLARDFRKLQELGDGVDGRHGEPSAICFEQEEAGARRGPPVARPPTRVLCVTAESMIYHQRGLRLDRLARRGQPRSSAARPARRSRGAAQRAIRML